MKKLLLPLCLMLFACQQGNSEQAVVNESVPSAKELVEQNAYIDVPDFGMQTQGRASEVDKESRKAKVKAALYRFYKHVEIIDSQYVYHLKGGDEINVSPATFDAMVGEIEKSNEFIRKCNAEGKQVAIAKIDEAYLESLLDPRPLQERIMDAVKK